VGQHASVSGAIMLGLDECELRAVVERDGELQITVQTTATLVGWAVCGVRARSHARRTVRVRDRPIGGRPVVLV
jgi:hypothetical protein